MRRPWKSWKWAGVVLAIALVATAAQAGPISKLKTMQFEPDLDSLIICKAERCGLDATCAMVMEIDDIRQIRTRTVDLLRPVRLIAAGELSDRLWAVGEPGQRVKANGRGLGDFVARELYLPTGDVEQDLVRKAIEYAQSVCGVVSAQVETPRIVPDLPEPVVAPDSHLMPAITAANAALGMAAAALEELGRYPGCPGDLIDEALKEIDEYEANDNPIRRSE